MKAAQIQFHALAAFDVNGNTVCACGVTGDRREHLATVALQSLGAREMAPVVRRPEIASTPKRITRAEQAAWRQEQHRLANLATYRWPEAA